MSHKELVKAMLNFRSDPGISGSTLFFSSNPAANDFIIHDPNAFLIGAIFNQNIPFEKAWLAPYLLKQRLGYWNMKRISKENPQVMREAVKMKPALHRYHYLCNWVREAAGKLASEYEGDASKIWSTTNDAKEIIRRLLTFKGVGQKKANMTAIILHESFNIKMKNIEEIDVPYDVHIRRVFLRAGLINKDEVREVVAVGRMYSPEYPGKVDQAAWTIGKDFCHPQGPRCLICPIAQVCPRLINKDVT